MIEQNISLVSNLLKPQNILKSPPQCWGFNKSLTDHLTTIESTITPEIINSKNWQNVKEISNIFPQAITNFFGFEYRLSNTDAYSDFLLCIDADEAGKKILGDTENEIKLPANLIEQSEWQQLANFAQLWCEGKFSPSRFSIKYVAGIRY